MPNPTLDRTRHWFWHIIAIANLIFMNPSEDVTDSEWDCYLAFMKKHGFDRTP